MISAILRCGRMLAGTLVALILTAASADALAAALRVGGTGSGLGPMRILGEAFSTDHPGLAVEVLPSLGSGGGIRALIDGAIDVAVSARPLKPAEAEQPIQAIPLSRTPFMLVSSHPMPGGVASDALAGLYGDPSARWADGTPVRIILRPESDTDSELLARFFGGMDRALALARQRPEVPIAATDQDNLQIAQRVPGSLTATTLTQLVAERANLRSLSLDGVVPTVDNLESGRYGLYKELFLVVRAGSNGTAGSFVTFVQSEDGRRILRETGNLPVR